MPELNQLFPVIETLNAAGARGEIVGVLGTLPLSTFAIVIFTLVCIIFAATSYDSASYTLAASATRSLAEEGSSGSRASRFLGFFAGLATHHLGIHGRTQTAAVRATLASVPLYAVTVILTISLWRSIHAAEQGSLSTEAVADVS